MTIHMDEQSQGDQAGNAIRLLQSILRDVESLLPTYVRETSVAHRVMPFEVMPDLSDWAFGVGEESAYLLRELDPVSHALELNLNGHPTGVFIKGSRYAIPITHKASQLFDPDGVALAKHYGAAITKKLAEGIVRQIDQQLRTLLNASVDITSQVINYSDALTRELIVDARNMLDVQELETENVVLQVTDLEKIPGYEATPLAATKEYIGGSAFVATSLTDAVHPGEIFFLAGAKYLGPNVLGDFVTNLMIDSNTAIFTAHTNHAMNIANVRAVAKLQREQ